MNKTTEQILWDLCGSLDMKVCGVRAYAYHGKTQEKAVFALQEAGIIKVFLVGSGYPMPYAVLSRDASQAAKNEYWRECKMLSNFSLVEC